MRFFPFLGLLLLLWGTSCNSVKPAGALGMVVDGDGRAGPPPQKPDYFDKPALPQNNAPVKFKMTF